MFETTNMDKLFIAADQKVKERKYWHNRFSGDVGKCVFPYDHRKGERAEETLTFKVNDKHFSQLMKLSNRSDHTLHMIMTALITALLKRYAHHNGSDVVVGSPIYRQDTDGEFINTVLPLKSEIKDGTTFKELLIQVRQIVLEAMEHYSYPLEVLVKELEPEAGEGEFPLFDIAVLLENIQDKEYMARIPTNMLFAFTRREEAITWKLIYNPQRYLPDTINRIALHLDHLMDQVLFEIDMPIDRIDMLTAEERVLLMEVFNGPRIEAPGMPIHRWFEQQVEKTPEKRAVAHLQQGNNDEPPSLSYDQLNSRANRLARILQSRGVGPNRIVGVIMEPSIDLVVGILAILKAGGAYLPIDHEYPDERILSILNGSGACLLLSRSNILEKYSFTALLGLQHARVEPRLNPVRPQSDFNAIAHPDRSLIDCRKYSNFIGHAMVRHAVSMQATRGCPYLCAYCHRTMQKKNVARSAENIFEEVKYYYDLGVKRFAFVDEIFNLDAENSSRFYRMLLKNKMDVQLFFPNGMRADRLTKDYIDLMVEAGTVNVGLALETASPRLQKLIKKNLNIDKLRENAEYFCSKYPNVIVELFTMHGFPTETEEEAMSTLNVIKSLKWIHFPYVFLLKVHPSTDMMQIALDSGVTQDAIERSMTSAFHEIPETLPYPKSFTRQYVARFMNEYFLNKERLLHVLPHQMKICSERELVGKYDNYLPAKITSFDDLIENAGITRRELGDVRLIQDDSPYVPDYRALAKSRYQVVTPKADALRVLLLDLSVLFSAEKKNILHGEITEPLGLMYLLTHLRETFKEGVNGKICKSQIDFDSFQQLKEIVCDFKPHLIGIRTLSYFKDFFHQSVALMREWGIDAPVIAGGPYGSSDYKLVLQDPEVALTVLKEGELTLEELVRKMIENGNRLPAEDVLETISGIAFIRDQDKPRLREQNRGLLAVDLLDKEIEAHADTNLDQSSKPEDLLYLISTSGSSGKPKSVMLEHRNLANLVKFEMDHTNLSLERVLQFASIGFDVSAQEIFSTLLSGGELFMVDRDLKNDVLQLFEMVRKHKITELFLPPAYLNFVFSESEYSDKFPANIRHIVAAGEQLVVNDAFREYLHKNKVYLHNHYGPSETHVVTVLTMTPGEPIDRFPSIGKPVANTRAYIMDEGLNLKPIGAVGELYIAGAAVGRGYYNNNEMTAEKFMSDPLVEGERMYRTNDLARRLPDGNIQFIGRSDSQVKVRGYRIELGEIESTMRSLKDVKEAIVLVLENETGEKYLTAYFVSGETLDVTDLREALMHNLPDFMIPSYFIQIPQIPLTANGKVDKRKLPAAQIDTAADYTPPRDDLDRKLVEVWAEVLDLEDENVGIDMNFFELGGHSLKATILISRLHKQLNVKLHLAEVFQAPTVREMADMITGLQKDAFEAIPAVGTRDFYPASYNQKRLWFVNRDNQSDASYNLPGRVTLPHAVDEGVIKSVFRMIVERHDAFRTGFKIENDELVQVVQESTALPFETVDISTESQSRKSSERLRLYTEFAGTGFNVTTGPLFRVLLVKVDQELYDLAYNMHHIISDGWSLDVLNHEFSLIYDALRKGASPAVTPLKIQYKDYAVWHNDLLGKGDNISAAVDFWKEQLDGATPAVRLPYDFNRDKLREKNSAFYRVVLTEEVTQKLRAIALENQSSLFMVMLAAFNMLLAHISGQQELMLAVPGAGRQHEDLKSIIGFFVNTMVLKNSVNADESFPAYLKGIQEHTIKTIEHQDYPLELVCGRLKIKFPEISVFFNMSTFGNALQETLNPYEPFHEDQPQPPKFDLVCYLREYKNGMEMWFHYFKELFKPATMEKLMELYLTLLTNIASDPAKQLKAYTPAETKKRKLSRG